MEYFQNLLYRNEYIYIYFFLLKEKIEASTSMVISLVYMLHCVSYINN